MRAPDLIIFDCDGVLVDSIHVFACRAPAAAVVDVGRCDFDRMVALPGLLAARWAVQDTPPDRLDPGTNEESST